jgi:hypothetical protein
MTSELTKKIVPEPPTTIAAAVMMIDELDLFLETPFDPAEDLLKK